MGEIGILVYAYGALAVCMLIEGIVSRARRDGVYRNVELCASLSMAVTYQLFELVTRGVTLVPYLAVASVAPFQLPTDQVWGWGGGFIMVDLAAYTLHRMAHEVNILWLLHEGHHSGEDYNLGTGPRQSFYAKLGKSMLTVPLALVVPPKMFITLSAFELLWALFQHTRYVRRLGPLERLLVTPSHHRVHHGRNAKYLDRNYGAVLILWDKLFGTFTEEQEEPLFGLTHPLRRHHLWEANIHGLRALWQKTRALPGLRQKVALWLARPGFVPAELGASDVDVDSDARRHRLADASLPFREQAYTTLQFVVMLSGLPLLIAFDQRVSGVQKGAIIALMLWAMTAIGEVLEGDARAFRLEPVRLVVSVTTIMAVLGPLVALWAGVWFLGSLLWWSVLARKRRPSGNTSISKTTLTIQRG